MRKMLFIYLFYEFIHLREVEHRQGGQQLRSSTTPPGLQTLRGSSLEIDYFYRLQHIKYSEWQLCEDFCQESSLLQAQI